jgi:hypothetical protein
MIAALLMLAQITPVPAEPKPIATTIAAIRKNPKKFDGRIVRLHGYVNSCRRLSCVIEERPANSPDGEGAFLSIGADAEFDARLRPLLPTYVEFDALVDASCLAPPASHTIIICADRVSELTVIRLRSVVSPEPPPFEKP